MRKFMIGDLVKSKNKKSLKEPTRSLEGIVRGYQEVPYINNGVASTRELVVIKANNHDGYTIMYNEEDLSLVEKKVQ